MSLVVLAIVFIPLREALYRVRDETIARATARDAARLVVPPDTIVSQQVDVSQDRIRIRMVTTSRVNHEKVIEAERFLLRRTGKDASIIVRRVAGEEELSLLRERLRPPTVTPVRDIESVRPEVLAQLEGPLKEIWPEKGAELTGYELGFDSEGVVLRVRCKAETPFDEIAHGLLSKALQTRLRVSKNATCDGVRRTPCRSQRSKDSFATKIMAISPGYPPPARTSTDGSL